MKCSAIALGAIATGIVFASGASFGQVPITVEDCRAGGNGIDQILERKGSDFALGVLFNRRGDKGKGNGGESSDLYINLIANPSFPISGPPFLIESFTVRCVNTADEDTEGKQFLVFPDGSVQERLGFTRIEYDPSNPNLIGVGL